MTLTHFSDILRMQLLYQNGAIWIDATIFLSDTISEDISNYEFYTIHHNLYSDFHVCKRLWTSSFMAANKGNLAIQFFSNMFFEYWKKEDCLICYFLIDRIMALRYENIASVKNLIDKVPQNSKGAFELAKFLPKVFTDNKYSNLKKMVVFINLLINKNLTNI